jgi:hypothetical protein
LINHNYKLSRRFDQSQLQTFYYKPMADLAVSGAGVLADTVGGKVWNIGVQRFGEHNDIDRVLDELRAAEQTILECADTLHGLGQLPNTPNPLGYNRGQAQKMITLTRSVWTKIQAFAKKLQRYIDDIAGHWRFEESEKRRFRQRITSVNVSTERLYSACRSFLYAYGSDQWKTLVQIEVPHLSGRGLMAAVTKSGGITYRRGGGDVSDARHTTATFASWSQQHLWLVQVQVCELEGDISSAPERIFDEQMRALEFQLPDGVIFDGTVAAEKEVKQLQHWLGAAQDERATDRRIQGLRDARLEGRKNELRYARVAQAPVYAPALAPADQARAPVRPPGLVAPAAQAPAHVLVGVPMHAAPAMHLYLAAAPSAPPAPPGPAPAAARQDRKQKMSALFCSPTPTHTPAPKITKRGSASSATVLRAQKVCGRPK